MGYVPNYVSRIIKIDNHVNWHSLHSSQIPRSQCFNGLDIGMVHKLLDFAIPVDRPKERQT